MFTKSLALAGLISLAATAALADPISATLVTPVTKPIQFIAGSTSWDCQGATCTATTVSEQALQGMGCREFTRQVGAVAVYGAFDAKRLAKCNVGTVNAPALTAQAGPAATVAAAH
jgi:hypothetical protein